MKKKVLTLLTFSFFFLLVMVSFTQQVRAQDDEIITDDLPNDIFLVREDGSTIERVTQFPYLDIVLVNVTDYGNYTTITLEFNTDLNFNESDEQFEIYAFPDANALDFNPIEQDLQYVENAFAIRFNSYSKTFSVILGGLGGEGAVLSMGYIDNKFNIITTFEIDNDWGFISYQEDFAKGIKVFDFSPDVMNVLVAPFQFELSASVILWMIVLGVVIIVGIAIFTTRRRRERKAFEQAGRPMPRQQFVQQPVPQQQFVQQPVQMQPQSVVRQPVQPQVIPTAQNLALAQAEADRRRKAIEKEQKQREKERRKREKQKQKEAEKRRKQAEKKARQKPLGEL